MSPGESVNAADVAQMVVKLCDQYQVIGLAYDAWRIDTLVKEFDRLGFATYTGPANSGSGLRIVPFVQGVKSFAPAIDGFEEEVVAGRLKHPNHPILTWNFMNAIAITDPAGNRKIDKSKTTLRIDGAVAAVMAFGLKQSDKEAMEAVDPWNNSEEFSVWL